MFSNLPRRQETHQRAPGREDVRPEKPPHAAARERCPNEPCYQSKNHRKSGLCTGAEENIVALLKSPPLRNDVPIFQKKGKKKNTTLTFTICNQPCIFIHSTLYKHFYFFFYYFFFYCVKLLAFQGNFCCQPLASGQVVTVTSFCYRDRKSDRCRTHLR